MLEKVFDFYEKHERRISSFALLGGFIFDNITLQRIDLLFENLLQITYLVISGGGIILINYFSQNPPENSFLKRVNELLPLFIQFTFGGLFSAFFIFYSRSATLSSSWPFVLVLLFLLIGNEFFKKRYQRMTFQVSIYFLAVFSFSIFFVPVILKKMSVAVFLLSGVVSLLFISLFAYLLYLFVRERFLKSRKDISIIIVLLFLLINVLYFSNLIPPIPLSLKEGGVYQSVYRSGGEYVVKGEKERWYDFITTKKINLKKGESAYIFSSVFAPTDLDIKIIHDWQYFDESKDKWISSSKISFPIRGGRDGGYRGFSEKTNIFPGLWRVDIKTERGQVIGREKFRVVEANRAVLLEEKVL